MSKLNRFKLLHAQAEPLLIGNVWNVQSAAVFEKMKFNAIATSSAAIADTLGYSDGQQMTFDEYFFIIDRIGRCTEIPFSVDLEAGYGTSAEAIANNIKRLVNVGVVGVNLEDSIFDNGERRIRREEEFASLLSEVVDNLKRSKIEVFVNVRSDVFLLGLDQPLESALKRIRTYETSGIDGLFFPCITRLEDITSVVTATKLPINVMAMPGLPTFSELQVAGVKRISMGNFLNKTAYQFLEDQVSNVVKNGNFQTLFQS